MNPRLAVWIVNGLLGGLAAATLFPLLWMLSASFMAPGASTSLPTPILPPSPTLVAVSTRPSGQRPKSTPSTIPASGGGATLGSERSGLFAECAGLALRARCVSLHRLQLHEVACLYPACQAILPTHPTCVEEDFVFRPPRSRRSYALECN